MRVLDFTYFIREAWNNYNPDKKIKTITDISAMVSTNHVYKVVFCNKEFIIAKLSYFGAYQHFVEDHSIINMMSDLLPDNYKHFLAQSLTKDNELYTYRHQDDTFDAWVVFYHPVKVKRKLPRKLSKPQIENLAIELANFHKACTKIAPKLPTASKTMRYDINQLLSSLELEEGAFEHHMHIDEIRVQCNLFLKNIEELNFQQFERIPVFVDWNIGNFSFDTDNHFFSRWDYDWFRMSTRVMDFYFFSRVCSSIGDRTVFSYYIDPFMEDRFLHFLKTYHAIFPLTRQEVLMMKESYRFFLLNYVINYGRHFFHHMYATKLQREAFELHFPEIDKKFDSEKILQALNL